MAEIRYHLDEHVPTAIAIGLRRRGIDVTTTVEAGLTSASDEAQLAFAVAERRIIVTRDPDFLILSANGAMHAGIAFAPKTARSIGRIVLSLVHLHRMQTAEAMQNRIEYL
jgi:hypothetical protein